MIRLRRDPLPRLLVEDLVAVARLLYRSWRAKKVPRHRLQALVDVGSKLRQALELSKLPVATTAHAEAWRLAEEATEELGRLVGSEERTVTLVTAAFRGMERREPPSLFQEREAQRLARRMRS